MIDNIFNKYLKINVSRETCGLIETYIQNVVDRNKEINLISKKSVENIRVRHIIDCAQAIDFIDKNDKKCIDLGSGAGLPGIVLAIIMKEKKSEMIFELYEKSYHKSKFLEQVSEKLKIKTKILKKDILKEKKLITDVVIARAFKPLPEILKVVHSNFKVIKNLIVFMGSNGNKYLDASLEKWKFDYKKKVSITNKDSYLINITNLKKID